MVGIQVSSRTSTIMQVHVLYPGTRYPVRPNRPNFDNRAARADIIIIIYINAGPASPAARWGASTRDLQQHHWKRCARQCCCCSAPRCTAASCQRTAPPIIRATRWPTHSPCASTVRQQPCRSLWSWARLSSAVERTVYAMKSSRYMTL